MNNPGPDQHSPLDRLTPPKKKENKLNKQQQQQKDM
jgi:hypothetical protein